MHKGIIDRLCPAAAAVASHDRRDDVDKLRKAGDLDAVGIAEEGEEHGTDEQSVFKIIDILEERQGSAPLFALPDFLILLVGMVPDVPLVEGEVDLLFAVLLAFDGIADGGDGMDKIVHVHGAGQEAGGIPRRIAVVPVEGDVVDIVIALVEHIQLPGTEGRHLRTGGAAGYHLDRGVDPLHHFGGFVCYMAVLPCRLPAHLPGAVHLVAETPDFDVEGVLLPVGDTQIREFAAAAVVGILYNVSRLLGPACAEVDGIHHLSAGPVRPAGKLMEADFVGLGSKPGKVKALRPARHGADAVFPVKTGDKIPARITDNRHTELFHCLNDIGAETEIIRQRMARLVNATIDGAAEMLDKGAEKPFVYSADPVILIQNYFCLLHSDYPFTLPEVRPAINVFWANR